MKINISLLGIAILALFAGCKTPSVNLTTSTPVKVDIDMRLDVYEHGTAAKATPVKQPDATKTTTSTETHRHNRMADIQTMKNSRIIGEGHDGLLAILSEPAGEYGEYVRVTVRDENADRMALMKKTADEEKLPLTEIQKKKAELWRNQAFKGEEIEEPLDNGAYHWVQKQ